MSRPPWRSTVRRTLIEKLSQYPRAELEECWQELKELAEEKLLFEEEDYINPQWAVVKNTPIKALCLNVAHDCNLRCKYCFASTGGYRQPAVHIMSPETAKRAIDFVIEQSGKRHNIEVDFFGGEPLMAMDTVKETVAYARSIEEEKDKNFRFTITTNGMLLNPREHPVHQHRSCRTPSCPWMAGRKSTTICVPPQDGKGSYDIIVPKFQELVEQRGDQEYYLRGTFTKENLDFADDVLHICDDLGFTNVSVEPATGKDGDPLAITDGRSAGGVRRVREAGQGNCSNDRRDVNFFHFYVDLEQGPCVIKRMRGCGAGNEYVAITPEGDIYPCHQFVGNDAFKMGNLYDGSFRTEIADQFGGVNIYTKEACRKCWAKFYCSGGCSASNFNVNGDIMQPSEVACELERKRLECAIAMSAIRSGLAEPEAD